MLLARVRTSLWLGFILLIVPGVSLAPAFAQVAKQGNDLLSSLSFVHEKLHLGDDSEPLDNLRAVTDKALQNGWEAFRIGVGPTAEWSATIDKRTGFVGFAEGGNVAWIPGHGNKLALQNLAGLLKAKAKVDLEVMDAIARGFMPRVKSFLGIDPSELVLNQGRSGQPARHVWFVDYDVIRGGMTVEGARVVFRVNNGNLIQYGTENLPPPGTKVPPTRLTKEQALAAVSQFIGGFQAGDTFHDTGSLHLLPVAIVNSKLAEGYEIGKGRGLVKVWQIVFHRDDVLGTWQARVDATTGEVLELTDINDYAVAQATGGVYQNSPATGPEIVRPLPYADLSSGGFTNSAGLFTRCCDSPILSTLAGQYVKINDACGAISQASDGFGNFAFGTSSGTDCTTPGYGGDGNTHASRQQFYQVNRIKEVVRGWLPGNTWINQQLTVNVNLAASDPDKACIAFWDGRAMTLNFPKSGVSKRGVPCVNKGEVAGLSLHEFGHGLDQSDGTGRSTDSATRENYGDTTALIALHDSCLGAGTRSSNCTGYGDGCTSCTGVRDADYAKHTSNTPATADNFIRVHCRVPKDSGDKGPCGLEGHCESYVPTETMWDLAARDLPSPGTSIAWTILDRLWYLSRNTAKSAFSCTPGTTYTSNGCGAGSLWEVFRAVDDDDGNLSNGTPHGGALFAAFNRHAIACTTDPGANVTFAGCTPPAAPTLTITPGDNQASLTWTAAGSSTYDVFRNETGCNAGFTRIASGTSATSLVDNAVANDLTYYYQVTAYPAGNESCASVPSTCVAVSPAATYMFYKGSGTDAGIYVAHSSDSNLANGSAWSATRLNLAINTSDAPAPASLAGNLYVLYKGSVGDSRIYVAQSGSGDFLYGPDWSANPLNPAINTSTAPAVAALNGTLYMLYKGSGSDSNVYIGRSTTNTPGDGSSWSASRLNTAINTSAAPAVAALGSNFYMLYKGSGGDTNIYIGSSTGGDISDGSTWSATRLNTAINTSVAPGVVVFNGTLYMFYKGSGSDTNIYIAKSSGGSILDGSTWSATRLNVTINTVAAPRPVVVGNSLYLFYMGSGGDTKIWVANPTTSDLFNGDAWQTQPLNSAINTSTAPGAAVMSVSSPTSWTWGELPPLTSPG